jgi:hypothetical protein
MLLLFEAILHVQIEWIYNGCSNVLETLRTLPSVVRVTPNCLYVLHILNIQTRTPKHVVVFSGAKSSKGVPPAMKETKKLLTLLIGVANVVH